MCDIMSSGIMKPPKFSINDILTRSPTVSSSKLDTDDQKLDQNVSHCITSLPTPPQSPETESKDNKNQRANKEMNKSPLDGNTTNSKRKRDPIGQILDSLCSKAEKKSSIEPSAFSPIITSTSSPQLSPLSMLSQVDRRCVQTSPNSLCTSYPQPVTSETYNQAQISMDKLKLLEAQKLAQFQQIHHQQQQARLHQRQQQLHNQSAIFNGRHFPYFMPAAPPHNIQQLQMMQERQAHLIAMDNYKASLLANNNCVGNVANPTRMTGPPPMWLSWMKVPNNMDQMTSLPVKESRIPPPPRYQCDACKKSYSTFGGLSKHKQFHCVSHVKKEFNCKYCEKSYGSLGALKMHIRTHTLPCKCKLCGKAFSRPWLLQGHVRTHTGEKPFKCAHCGRAFADRSNLRAHLQTHSDIKKYACKNCTKTFSRMSLLLKHEEGSCMGIRR